MAGFNRVLTHQARVIGRAATGQSIEGTKQYAVTYGPWFKCRLFPDETPETDSGARGGRRMLMRTPHLLVGTKALDGSAIPVGEIGPQVRVEVDAGELGHEVWQVTSDPQTLMTVRKNLGYYFGLRRVDVAGADA